jgi:hypothetical protein
MVERKPKKQPKILASAKSTLKIYPGDTTLKEDFPEALVLLHSRS